jgi:hypothetical protein
MTSGSGLTGARLAEQPVGHCRDCKCVCVEGRGREGGRVGGREGGRVGGRVRGR